MFVTQSAMAIYIANQQLDKNSKEYIVLQEESDADDSESFDDFFDFNDLLISNPNFTDFHSLIADAQNCKTAYLKLNQNPHKGYSQTHFSPPDTRI